MNKSIATFVVLGNMFLVSSNPKTIVRIHARSELDSPIAGSCWQLVNLKEIEEGSAKEQCSQIRNSSIASREWFLKNCDPESTLQGVTNESGELELTLNESGTWIGIEIGSTSGYRESAPFLVEVKQNSNTIDVYPKMEFEKPYVVVNTSDSSTRLEEK